MTTEVTTVPVTDQNTEAPKPKDISDPNISFADYQRLRRGETLAGTEQSESAHAQETEKVQKKSSDSETDGNKAKQDDDAEESGDEHSEEGESKDDAAAKDKTKKRGGFQRRIDKLNAAKSAAQQEVEYWKQLALKGAGAPKTEATQDDSKPATADGEPDPDKFDTHAEYVRAVARWEAKQLRDEGRRESQKKALETERAKLAETYSERVKAFAEKVDDFQDAIDDVDDIPVSPAVSEIIFTSENGPALAYELAKNRAEFERINKLPPLAAARELGKIESRLASQASKETKPQTKTTQAPKPMEPVRGGQAKVAKSIDDPDLSFTDYVKLRREQMKRRGA